MSAKTSGRLSGRLIYAATIVAILGVTGGLAMGTSLLTPSTVTQTASYYGGASGSVTGMPAPTLALAYSGGPACQATNSSTVSGKIVNVTMSAWSGATNCTSGHFSEEFTFTTYSATISTVSIVFTISTQVGSFAYQSNSATLTLGTGTSGAFTATIHVYVDYGANSAPTPGITALTLLVQ